MEEARELKREDIECPPSGTPAERKRTRKETKRNKKWLTKLISTLEEEVEEHGTQDCSEEKEKPRTRMKVGIAESFLQGDALNWYMSLDADGGTANPEDLFHKLRTSHGGVSPLGAKERLRRVRMTDSLEDCITELDRVRHDCSGLAVADEVQTFIDGLHP